MKKEILFLFIKGIPIGISNVLPGISGGTIAIILNIYDVLIDSIKKIKLSILFPIFLGAAVGLLSTANLVGYLLDSYPGFMNAIIFGMILASVKVTVYDIKKIDLIIITLFIMGFIISYFLGRQSIDAATTYSTLSIGKIVFSGIFASVAMLLPGISGATVLVMLGMYEYIIDALISFNTTIIAVFALSAVLGTIALAWILSYLLKNYRSQLMSLITGLIIGSALVVLPKQISIVQVTGIIIGIALVFMLSKN